MEQKLIWVDLMDQEIGCGEKLETHQKNILHRAFSVFLYSNGKILIQQREAQKYHSGGLWANSCCSHPRQGEDILTAADRRWISYEDLEKELLEEPQKFATWFRIAAPKVLKWLKEGTSDFS